MKRQTSFLLALAAVSMMITACAQNSTDFKASALSAGKPVLATQTDTLSWAYGQNIADALQKGYFAELDAELVLRSAAYALAGGEQPLSEKETKMALDYVMFMYSRTARQESESQQAAADRQQQIYFDTLLRNHPEIQSHPSGFYYLPLQEGKGRKAQYGLRVSFDYRSFFLMTGQPYDQTYGKRDPIVHVIGTPMFPGLIEAFQLMSAGSRYRFYFPYQVCFGARGSDGIPPFTPMIYEIELHEIYDN